LLSSEGKKGWPKIRSQEKKKGNGERKEGANPFAKGGAPGWKKKAFQFKEENHTKGNPGRKKGEILNHRKKKGGRNVTWEEKKTLEKPEKKADSFPKKFALFSAS